ncbi:MAG: glycyl-radical enzyme activating protein [Spirochaetia bacterium]|nr:glycyl-radical enzyme activating protein [Spirochaetia bacterium]
MTGTVFDIKRFAIHDGPGIRTSVFLKGCPLRCEWCQNPEGIPLDPILWYFSSKCIKCGECVKNCPVDALTKGGQDPNYIEIDHDKCTLCGRCTDVCPTAALSITGEEKSTEWVASELLKDKVFYEKSGGGITLTGGDPLYQHEFSLSILKAIKEYDIHTAVETAMFGMEENLLKFVPFTDLFLVDFKILDNDKHKVYTGVENKLIKSNFERLSKKTENILVRVPLIPGYTATEENIINIRDYVYSIRADIRIELLNFNPLARDKYKILHKQYPTFQTNRSYSEEEMQSFNRFL